MEVNNTNRIHLSKSEGTAKDVNYADEGGRVPLDGDGAIDLIIPVAGAWEVEAAIGLLHDDTVSDELEVSIDASDGFEDLHWLQ